MVKNNQIIMGLFNKYLVTMMKNISVISDVKFHPTPILEIFDCVLTSVLSCFHYDVCF